MDYINLKCDSDNAMILVCPQCDTRYFADDSSIGAEGRRVRCASCGHSWYAKPQESSEIAAAESTGLTREQVERLRQTAAANSAARSGPHAEFRAKEHARRRRNRAMAAGIAWTAGFLIFAGVAAGAILLRNEVAEAWPRTATVYRMLGFDVNRFGLQLVDVGAKRSFDGTTPVLTVTGNAMNIGKTPRAAPRLRVSLRDEKGAEIHSWTDELGVDSIAPGQVVKFTSRIVAPPLETYGLAVTFAPRDGGDTPKGEAAVGHEAIRPAEGEHVSAAVAHTEGAPAEPVHEEAVQPAAAPGAGSTHGGESAHPEPVEAAGAARAAGGDHH